MDLSMSKRMLKHESMVPKIILFFAILLVEFGLRYVSIWLGSPLAFLDR